MSDNKENNKNDNFTDQSVSDKPPRSATPYPEDLRYQIRFFPEIEIRQGGSRRSSIPTHPDNLDVTIYNGRRHSEVILSPSDAFRRDYFKFSPFNRVNQYVSDVLTKLNKKFRSEDAVSELKSGDWKFGSRNMTQNGDNLLKQYLNPLESSDNGNEQLTIHSDDFFEGDEEIGRPNSHSTPKHSPPAYHDSLYVATESGRSSRRNSNEAVDKLEKKEKIKNQNSVSSTKTTETILNPSSLHGSPEGAYKKSPEKSILRHQSSNPNSPRKRRRSVDFKMQSTHSDETLNRYSNNLQDDRQSSHGHYEDNLKTVMFFHPHLTHPRWDHANVNGTHHPDRRFSRVSVHPLLTTIPRDGFGPRLSTVVDEVMTNKSAMDQDDMDSLIKCSEIEYASGGLLSFSAEEHSPSAPNRPPDTETLLFVDGRRRIDMVLVYEEEDFGVMTEAEMLRRERRKIFRENLEKEGLEFELEDQKASFDEKTFFLKIHAPWQVMTRYAELMNIKMPIKRLKPILNSGLVFNEDEVTLEEVEKGMFPEKPKPKPKLFSCLGQQTDDKASVDKTGERKTKSFFEDIFEYDHSKIAEEPSFYKATFSRDREEQFVVKDRETFFTSAQRSQIVWQILMRAKYDDTEKVGIRRLLNDGTFLAAYPLHEGSYEVDAPNGFLFDRRLLYLEWARPSKWFKKQPLWLIRKYFGDKIGLYFAWLGFYTYMLFPPAIVGVLCFLYGVCSIDSDHNIPSKEICNSTGVGNITLCPLCDVACRYIRLKDSCVYAQITYLFDNPATVFFAIFMSFWATTYLELWKRQQSVIIWEWDLQFIEEDEEPRPEFETSVKTFRINPVTREKEPYLPAWSRALRFFATGTTVLCMIIVVLGAVLGTIIYRISLVTIIYRGGAVFKDHAKIFTSVTAAILNLIIIMILTKFYHGLAIWLTNVENPRTQTEYEDSYTFKIFLFEFVNFYSSLIYIAFFKGRFFAHPGDKDSRSSEFLKLKNDICDPAGCLSELCIQLAIIMVGKQCLNNILELLYPKFWNWWYHRIHHNNTKKDFKRDLTRWEEDYQMQDAGRLALFEEYLEMVLQYGFVTLFVAAFPLAPLFALLNNIIEIRLDAYKMVTQSRRPLAERVEDIGAWYGILKGLTYTAVVSNAFVIAYTSDFIPRMVFKFVHSTTGDLTGYIESSLSKFNTSGYVDGMGSPKDDPDPDFCYYRGYRNGPEHPTEAYELSPHYWHVFAARLAFVVVFEHIVFALTGVMAYIIPDVPAAVKTQMQRERLLAKEARYERGLKNVNSDDELLAAIRDQNHSRLDDILRRGSWGRRLSKHSDSLDAHVDVASKSRKMSNSTVWEVT